MEPKVCSIVYLDNGKEIKVDDDPCELIEKFKDGDGKISDEFIEIGLYYINPKHVTMVKYDEKRPRARALPKPHGW